MVSLGDTAACVPAHVVMDAGVCSLSLGPPDTGCPLGRVPEAADSSHGAPGRPAASLGLRRHQPDLPATVVSVLP